MKDKKDNIQTSVSKPWGPLAGQYKGLLQDAGAFSRGKDFPAVYGGNWFANPNGMQQGAWGDIARTAKQPNPLMGGLLSEANEYISGNRIGESNPYLMANLGTAAREATDATNGMFSAGGRYGGGAHQGVVADQVGQIYSQGLGAQMNADMDRQMQWAGMAPQINEFRYADAAKLGQVGDIRQAQRQAKLDSNRAKFDAWEARPMDRINWLNSILSGAPYQSTSQSQPKGSMASGILGGGLAGYGVGGPWGALGGGLLGAFI